jgi:general secretion pathway protein D
MNDISHRKYQYIRAQQLNRQAEGISLMPFEEGPTLPPWDDALTLPPSFEEYITAKDKRKND